MIDLGSTTQAYTTGAALSTAVPPLAPVVAGILALNKGLNALGIGGGGTKFVIDRLWPQLEAKAKAEGLPMTRPEFDAYFAVTYGTPSSSQTQTYDQWIAKMNALHAPKPQPVDQSNTPLFASLPGGSLIEKYKALPADMKNIVLVTGALGVLVLVTAGLKAAKVI